MIFSKLIKSNYGKKLLPPSRPSHGNIQNNEHLYISIYFEIVHIYKFWKDEKALEFYLINATKRISYGKIDIYEISLKRDVIL